jgi:hypothetical protein
MLQAGDSSPAKSTSPSLTESQTAGLAWLRKQVAPPPRFANYDAQFSARRRTLPLADGRSQDVVLVYDRERVIGVWNQGSNPGMRRFHLLVTKPGTGLDEAGLKALLARHLCRFGYDAQWSPGGAIATVSPWFPSESEQPDRIEVTLGPAGSECRIEERTSFRRREDGSTPECTMVAELTIRADPVHGYCVHNRIRVETDGLFVKPGRLPPSKPSIMSFSPTIGAVQDVWHGRAAHDMTLFTPEGSVAADGALRDLRGYRHNAASVRARGSAVDPAGLAVMLAADPAAEQWSIAVVSDGPWRFGPCPLFLELTTSCDLPPPERGMIRWCRTFALVPLPPEMSAWLRERVTIDPPGPKSAGAFAKLGIATSDAAGGAEPRVILLPIGCQEDFETQPWPLSTPRRGVLVPRATIDPGAGRDGSRCLRIKGAITIATSPYYPPIRLEPKRRYRLSAWARTTLADCVGRLEVRCKNWNAAPKADQTPAEYRSPEIADAWQHVKIEWATGADDLATEARLHFNLSGKGDLLVDDFCLTRMD